MPIQHRKDKNGPYFRWVGKATQPPATWGDLGKKYYYDPKSLASGMIAKNKALIQGQAISISKYKNKLD